MILHPVCTMTLIYIQEQWIRRETLFRFVISRTYNKTQALTSTYDPLGRYCVLWLAFQFPLVSWDPKENFPFCSVLNLDQTHPFPPDARQTSLAIVAIKNIWSLSFFKQLKWKTRIVFETKIQSTSWFKTESCNQEWLTKSFLVLLS